MKRNENIRINNAIFWNGHTHSYSAPCACMAITTRYEKIEHNCPWKMCIRLYFKPVSSLPTLKESGNGAVATKEANIIKPCSVFLTSKEVCSLKCAKVG